MATRRQYTLDQLLHLRQSPLCTKPEDLPAIEQWIEYVYLDVGEGPDGKREKLRIPHSEAQQTERQSQQQRTRQDGTEAKTGRQPRNALGAGLAEASPMGSFGADRAVRPGLVGLKSSAAARSGEDITLGPPKTLFASSRTTSKLSDFADKSLPSTEREEADTNRSTRTFGDKQMNRKSLGNIDPSEPPKSHTIDSWTLARERRALGGEDEKTDGSERNPKYGRRNDRPQEDGSRINHNGYGDRQDSRWLRDGEKREQQNAGERQGGWRERERERRDNRDWTNARGHTDNRKPEWMDEPAPREQEDDEGMGGGMGMPKNQEEFEAWKRAQHERNKKSTDVEAESVPADPPPVKEQPPYAKQVAPLKLDAITDRPFGSWTGEAKTSGGASSSADGVQTPLKSSAGMKGGKTSRFMPLFAKKEEPKEETPVSSSAAPPSGEDKAGFDRILMMLGGNGKGPGSDQVSAPTQSLDKPMEFGAFPSGRPQGSGELEEVVSPAPRQVSNGNGAGGSGKPRSRFTGFFDQTPKSPERVVSPQDAQAEAGGRGFDGRVLSPPGVGGPFGGFQGDMGRDFSGVAELPADHARGSREPQVQANANALLGRAPPPTNALSPEPSLTTNGAREQRPQHGRTNDLFIDQPARQVSTPDLNIQNLLAARPNPRQQADNQNSQFLLNLLQTKSNSRPPSSQQQAPRLPATAEGGFQLWREQPPSVPEPHAPKPRTGVMPPGLFEEQLLRNHQPAPQQIQEMPANEVPRRQSQRAPPPGFYEEPNAYQQQVHNQPPLPRTTLQEQQLQLREYTLQQQQLQQHHQRNFTEPARHFPGPQGGARRMSGHPGLSQMQIPTHIQPVPPYPGEYSVVSPTGPPTAPPGFNQHMPRHQPGMNGGPNIFSGAQQQHQQQQQGRDPRMQSAEGGPGGMTSPPGFYGNGGGGGGLGMPAPPGFMGMRSPVHVAGEGMPVRGGRGYEGFAGAYGQGR
ncbi:hypothetical protein LTR56_007004 [Elasticomyces elasticus]|nr:hypothetical protein LTR56_007004 [Elasticomyces elasticus]KAK3664126.1 hypothetical protein LTR22_005091 [Elasticomyces elasticus]KAK5767066.1 hypothetical protein LTS12_002832 [Elasticomyces elasticus]